MGKTRVIAETGAGQHGVATATAAALLGLECTVYMGEEDTRRQALNVARMRLLGAEVVPVDHRLAHAQGRHQRGHARLGDQRRAPPTTCSAPSPARTRSRRWSATSSAVIGEEARAQVLEQIGRLPDAVAACVGGGSNAIGIFHAFLDDAGVRAGRLRGRRRRRRDRPARAPRSPAARPACCTAPAPTCCRTRTARRSSRTRSRPASTTPASAPSTPGCTTSAAPTYRPVTDAEAMEAFRLLCRTEGIIPAIESAHALAGALRARPRARARTRVDPGEPVRPRRQGRGDRGPLVRPGTRRRTGGARRRAPAGRRGRGSGSDRHDRRRDRDDADAAGRAALVGYLPVGFPTVDGSIDAMRAHGRGRRRRRRARRAVLRPGDGRPGDPGAPSSRRSRAGVRMRDGSPPSSAVAARAPPVLVMTYWNPVVRYGVERFAADLARPAAPG